MDSGYNETRRVLLADDDDDDRLLFLDVLKELRLPVQLSSASNGEALMKILAEGPLPHVLFLDLNMPLKNGFECLLEIRRDTRLDTMPVVIFSTSSQPSAIDRVYSDGAQLYIRKPNDFTQLKSVIHQALTMDWSAQSAQVTREEFVLKSKVNGK
jgi:CheY-like chemotaxis protein